MFTQSDRLYHRSRELNVIDFIPSPEDRRYLKEAFECMIYDVATDFFAYDELKLPKGDFAMPKIFPLDPRNRPKIFTLPTYDLNEGVLAELIKIWIRYSQTSG